MLLVEGSTVGSELTVIHIIHRRMPYAIHTCSYIKGKLEIPQKLHLSISRSCEGVAFRNIPVESDESQRIGIRSIRTYHSGILSVTEIIHLKSSAVRHNISGSISDIDRIDRSHGSCKTEDVSHRAGTSLLPVSIIVIIIGIRHVGADLKPFLRLKIRFQTGCISVHIRSINDSLVVQITE